MALPGCSRLRQGLFGAVPATVPVKVNPLWVLIPCGLAAVTGLLAAAGEVVGVALVVVLISSVLLSVLKGTGGTVRTPEVGKAEIASRIQSLSLVTRV